MTTSAAICAAASAMLLPRSSHAQSPAAPKNLRLGASTKALLGPNDFASLGSFYANNEGGDAIYQAGLTHRYVSGQLKLYTMTLSENLLEMSVPTLRTSSFNDAPVSNNYGNIFSGKKVIDDPNTYPRVRGIYWDETDQRMYWLFLPSYSAYGDLQCLGYSTLNDTNHTGTGIKAVYMPLSLGYKWAKGISPIPSWFASQYTNGYRLGVGFGGYESGVGSGGCSLGPAFIAMDPADITATPDKGRLTNNVPMVQYSANASDRSSPWRGRRDKDYYFTGESGWQPGAEPYGWFTWTDYIYQSACWVDTPTKTGFFVLAFLSSLGTNGTYTHATQSVVSGTTTGCVLSGALPGLSVGEFVTVDGPYQPVKITGINGLNITYTDVYGNPLVSAPTIPGLMYRGQYYVESDLCSVHGKNTAFVYDPTDLARGVQGQVTKDLVQWKNTWDMQLPGLTYPLPSYMGGWVPIPGTVTGMTFDSTTNRLYIMCANNPPVISVYQIA